MRQDNATSQTMRKMEGSSNLVREAVDNAKEAVAEGQPGQCGAMMDHFPSRQSSCLVGLNQVLCQQLQSSKAVPVCELVGHKLTQASAAWVMASTPAKATKPFGSCSQKLESMTAMSGVNQWLKRGCFMPSSSAMAPNGVTSEAVPEVVQLGMHTTFLIFEPKMGKWASSLSQFQESHRCVLQRNLWVFAQDADELASIHWTSTAKTNHNVRFELLASTDAPSDSCQVRVGVDIVKDGHQEPLLQK